MSAAGRAAELSGLTRDELDALPCGAIKIDLDGRILSYNAAEGAPTGRDPARLAGRDFFTEVAPCTQVREFQGRSAGLAERRSVNREFEFTFALEPPAGVRITMLYEQREGAARVLVDRG